MKKYQSYPGTRDFYPKELQKRNWFFHKQKEICEKYGYVEYSAPILEYTDLYRSKSSEEIVNEQLYTFIDRGNREVSIRPEMTPTLARMIASRSMEYVPPLRWFSIANFMRYERPGKGRLREFYQLNVDLIGDNSVYADSEILSIAMDILKSYNAKEDDFIIRFSDRRLLDLWLDIDNKEQLRQIGRILDKKEKITEEQFHNELKQLCSEEQLKQIYDFLNIKFTPEIDLNLIHISSKHKEQILSIFENFKNIYKLLKINHNTKNLIFDPSIVRGFDYYTGLIFEIYDTHPENKRAIFGGGRYDNLIGQFSKEALPAIGFGMGDVTLEEFLKIHKLLPDFEYRKGLYFSCFDENLYEDYLKISNQLRDNDIQVELSLSRPKKFGKELELAERKGYKFVLIYGEDEKKEELIKIKDLSKGKETNLSIKDFDKFIYELKTLIHS